MSDSANTLAYSSHDQDRWAPEPPKDPSRTAFERDRARVLHSAALRRLGAKTQVRTPWRRNDFPVADDFIRTRLTHSLEVAQVGRQVGKSLGCDPDVVDTSCLAHDLGHPPFGHNGERALAEVSEDIGGFEGNAQTLRLLTRLEAKVIDPRTGAGVGLNLTRASLDATTKYPWLKGQGPLGSNPAKFGVYDDDWDVFAWLKEGAEMNRRCIEAQVMDFSDDVAYSVHDVEDAVFGSGLDLREIAVSESARSRVVEMALARYLFDSTTDELDEAAQRLVRLPYWVDDYDGSRRALTALKDMTSQLIGRFASSATAATRDRYGPERLIRYNADLVVPRPTEAEIAVLKSIAAVYVMEPRNNDRIYGHQREIVHELYEHVLNTAPLGLERLFADDWAQAPDDAARRRVVVDQVASLTDTSAVLLHAQLVQPGGTED